MANIAVSKISETSSTITIGWTTPANQEGYVPTIDGSEKLTDGKRHPSVSTSANKTTITKPSGETNPATKHKYGVVILGNVFEGSYDPTVPPPPPPTRTVTGSITQGSTLTGKVTWTADNGPVIFTIDGGASWQEDIAPYVYNGDGATLDTTTLSNASHTFKVALTDGSASHTVSATVANSVTPPPPPPTPPPTSGRVGAPGLIRLAGLFPTTSHISDGTYPLMIADWELVDQLAKQPGITYAYRNLGPPGWKPINLSDPDGFVNECIAAKRANPGLDGIFLDNTNSWDRATQIPFLQNVGPRLKAAGLGIMPNAMANDSYKSGANGNDGSADRAWYQEIAPYVGPYIFIEYYQMRRDQARSTTIRVRGSNWYENWDGWQNNVKAIHDLGMMAVGDSYNGKANAIYCRASFLLVAGPGDVFCGNYGSAPDGADSYDPAWMKEMGAPIDPPDATKTTRRFANGTVSVNPVAGTASIS